MSAVVKVSAVVNNRPITAAPIYQGILSSTTSIMQCALRLSVCKKTFYCEWTIYGDRCRGLQSQEKVNYCVH